jgi:hypothetical protein
MRSSGRVQRHLQHRLQEEPDLRVSIVVRRWAQIQPELEFRCVRRVAVLQKG